MNIIKIRHRKKNHTREPWNESNEISRNHLLSTAVMLTDLISMQQYVLLSSARYGTFDGIIEHCVMRPPLAQTIVK